MSLAILFLFTYEVLQDTVLREWMSVQREFNKTYRSGERAGLEIKQFQLADFRSATGRVQIDRCTTCHLAIEETDPKYQEAKQPFRSHPGDYLKQHPPDVYGCTICHAGQGMALTKETAHGYHYDEHGNVREVMHHLDTPMLRGSNIQAACIKCHQGGAHGSADYTPAWTKGRKLFKEFGCIGCHALNGVGGKIAPDLTEVGSKYPDQFDMRHLDGEHTKQVWIYEHFLDPQEVVQADPAIEIDFPSDMPNAKQFGMSDDDARALTVYMLSLTPEKMYSKYVIPAKPEKERTSFPSRIARGEYVYRKLGCIGCHGKPGVMEDQRKNWNSKDKVVPKLGNLSEIYTRQELKEFILRGSYPPKEDENLASPPLWMPIWKDRGLGGAELEALLDFLFTIKLKKAAGEEEW